MIAKDYIRFIHQRDKYLEEYLRKTHLKQADAIRACFEDVISFIHHLYPEACKNQFTSQGKSHLDNLYFRIDQRVEYLTMQLANIMDKLAKRTYILSYASEYDAISKVKNISGQLQNPEYLSQYEKFYASYSPAIFTLTGKIKQKIQTSYVIDRPLDELNSQIQSLLPKTTKIKRELIPLREADRLDQMKVNGQSPVTYDFIPDEIWYDLIHEYKSEYISPYRNKTDANGEFYKVDDKYVWEVEQKTTNDFLDEVKSGSKTAAKERGINDFIWISVLDDRTRDLHRMFHGKTSSEIKDEFEAEYKYDKDGDLDPNYGTVAPAGFNCRCRSVPYFKELEEEDREELITQDFANWMET